MSLVRVAVILALLLAPWLALAQPGTDVNVKSGSVQQGPAGNEAWPVQAHQGGAWSVSVGHISSALHIAGAVAVTGSVQQGASGGEVWPVRAHQGGSWSVSASQSNAWAVTAHQGGAWTISHVSAQLHIVGAGGAIGANQMGAWSMTVHQGTGWDHLVRQGAAGSEVWPVRAHQGGVWNVSANQSNAWAVTAHQGGAWNIDKVAHVTSVMAHVQGTVTIEGRGTAGTATGGVATVQGAANMTPLVVNVNHSSAVMHAVVTRNLTGTAGNQTCHSQASFVTTASAIIAHGAAGQRLYICGVVLNFATVTVSVIEGTGAACGTGPKAILGGTAATLGLVAGTYTMISPTPWLSTQTAGNQLCVLTSGSTPRVVGTVVYGAY